jgi:hypothetical protein
MLRSRILIYQLRSRPRSAIFQPLPVGCVACAVSNTVKSEHWTVRPKAINGRNARHWLLGRSTTTQTSIFRNSRVTAWPVPSISRGPCKTQPCGSSVVDVEPDGASTVSLPVAPSLANDIATSILPAGVSTEAATFSRPAKTGSMPNLAQPGVKGRRPARYCGRRATGHVDHPWANETSWLKGLPSTFIASQCAPE